MEEILFEEPPLVAPKNTIREAWLNILRDPGVFVRHWNYKGAILSGGIRAPIFLATYLLGKESLKLALGAALAQFIFRFLFAGVGGALIQAFRRVEPAWKALLSILLVVPVISHIFEFLVQSGFAYYTSSNSHTDQAIVRSICLSIFSALFSLYIMRRNVMIVGEKESKSLFSDIARLPVLVFDFLAFIPLDIARMLRRGEVIPAVLSVLGFGIFSQLVCWAFTNKFFWTHNSGQEIPFIKFWGIDGIILMTLAVGLSAIIINRNKKRQ